jgi:hypothetical protein
MIMESCIEKKREDLLQRLLGPEFAGKARTIGKIKVIFTAAPISSLPMYMAQKRFNISLYNLMF